MKILVLEAQSEKHNGSRIDINVSKSYKMNDSQIYAGTCVFKGVEYKITVCQDLNGNSEASLQR